MKDRLNIPCNFCEDGHMAGETLMACELLFLRKKVIELELREQSLRDVALTAFKVWNRGCKPTTQEEIDAMNELGDALSPKKGTTTCPDGTAHNFEPDNADICCKCQYSQKE